MCFAEGVGCPGLGQEGVTPSTSATTVDDAEVVAEQNGRHAAAASAACPAGAGQTDASSARSGVNVVILTSDDLNPSKSRHFSLRHFVGN
jgi:hypothetical protein